MAASGRWWAPLLVAAGTLVVPLATLTWQVLSTPIPEPPPPTPTPVPIAVVAPPVPTPSPTVAPTPVAPTPTPRIVLLPPTPTTVPREVWRRESAFNFVALGVDRRLDGEIPRTDTVMIGSVDLDLRRAALISIPRDLIVEIPGYGHDRINTAFVYGEQFKEKDGGIGLVKRTIEKNFGIPIHHYGMIDFACFRTAIDALGGVNVDVPNLIVDPRYPTEDFGYRMVRFEPGAQRLNGERALEYARTRNADSDFNRIRRQQQIVTAVRREILQLKSVPALPTIIVGCRGMASDLGFMDYVGLTWALQKLRDADISIKAIDEQMAIDAYVGGASVLLPRWEPIRALVRDTFPNTRIAASPGSSN